MSKPEKKPAEPTAAPVAPSPAKWKPRVSCALSVREAAPNEWQVEAVEYDADGNSEIHVLYKDPSEIFATAQFVELSRAYVAWTRSGYRADPSGNPGVFERLRLVRP